MPRGRPKKNKAPERKMILRLYRQFDIDLIYLFEIAKAEGKYDPQVIIKDAVRSYLYGHRNKKITSEVRRLVSGNLEIEMPRFRKYIQFHLILSEETDKDIISFFDGVTMGYRNAVTKGIVRWYIDDLCVYPALKTTHLRFVGGETKEDLFEHEKR